MLRMLLVLYYRAYAMGKRQKFNIKKVAKLIVKARKEHTMCEIAESM